MKSLQRIQDYEKFMVDLPDDDEPDFTNKVREEVMHAGYKIYTGKFVSGQGYENEDWLCVPNLLHHSKKYPWYTCYLKRAKRYWWDCLPSLHYFLQQHKGYEWVKRSDRRLKTSKFFIHIFLPKDENTQG